MGDPMLISLNLVLNSKLKVLGKFSKSKISNFGFSIVHKNVSDFQIPMDDILFSQIQKAFKDILDDWFDCLFSKMMPPPEFGLQITFVAQLCDNVAVAIACEYLKTSEYIGMVEFL